MIERSYAFNQIPVKVNSIQGNNAYVTDTRGNQYPPIPIYAIWGSGATPQVGETWMLVKDNGRWMLKARSDPVLPLVDGSTLASQALVQIGLAALAPPDTASSAFYTATLSTSVALTETPTSTPLMTVGPLVPGVWAVWANFSVAQPAVLGWASVTGISVTGGAPTTTGTGSLTLVSTLTVVDAGSIDIQGEWTSAAVTVSVGGYLALRIG